MNHDIKLDTGFDIFKQISPIRTKKQVHILTNISEQK